MPAARRSSASRRPAERRLRRATVVETHKSFCRFCHAVCGIEVDVEDGRVLAVRGDRDARRLPGLPVREGARAPRAARPPVPPPRRQETDARTARSSTWRARPRWTRWPRASPSSSRATVPAPSPSTPARTGSSAPAKPLVIAWANAIGTHWYFTPNTIDQPSQQTGLGAARRAGTPACSASPTPTSCSSSATIPASPPSRATAVRRTPTPSSTCATRGGAA